MHSSGSTSHKARILVVDDHPMVRDGVIRLISRQQDLAFCGEAATVAETYKAVEQLNPDLVILDLRIKGGDGLELIKGLKAIHPNIKILVLSQHNAPIYVERALNFGAKGYIAKDEASDEILNAIRAVLKGDLFLNQGTATLLLEHILDEKPEIEILTEREKHVFGLLGTGLTTRQVATELGLSFKTIESHRENIKRKLNIKTANDLIRRATEWGQKNTVIRGGSESEHRRKSKDRPVTDADGLFES